MTAITPTSPTTTEEHHMHNFDPTTFNLVDDLEAFEQAYDTHTEAAQLNVNIEE